MIVLIIVYKILKLKNIVVVIWIGFNINNGILNVICVKKFLFKN